MKILQMTLDRQMPLNPNGSLKLQLRQALHNAEKQDTILLSIRLNI